MGFLYNEARGRWWRERSDDAAHAYAYRNIARYIHDSVGRAPALIVDYACGAGHLLARLAWRFPHSSLAGLDGSSLLLGMARRRISHMGESVTRRIRLIETPLPAPNVLKARADLVVFAFPNMVPSPAGSVLGRVGLGLTREELLSAGELARANDPEYHAGAGKPHPLRDSLLQGRLVSRNLRGLLKRGGLCFRVEYGKARRHELSSADLMCVAFEEGSLDCDISGRRVPQWFRVLASSHFRSAVMEDVFQQTGEAADRVGGYLITTLRAL